MRITSRLDQDVQHNAVLVNRSPQPVATTTNTKRHLVEMPFVARSSSAPTQLVNEGGSELSAPAADGFITDLDAALGQEILDVTQAEVETVVEPDGVGDDFSWEAVTAIQRLGGNG